MRTRKQKKIPKKIKCAICPNRFVPKNKRQRYCSKKCYNKEKHIRENKIYNARQLARFNLPAGTRKMCQACPNPITEYGFCNACSQSCHDELVERYRIQAQKKPCKQCGHDITRARNYKYCSDKCRYEAWRDGKRKHPKNSNCKRCKNTITDKKQLVYCTAECRLKHIREEYDVTHGEKSAKTVLSCWSTCVARIVLPNVVACSTLLDRKNVMPRRQRLSERQRRIRTILKIMSKKYSGRQRREGAPCVACRDAAGLYNDMDQRYMKNIFLDVNSILRQYFIPFKPFTS